MEKRTPALLLLLLVAVFGTLGMACFFSVPGNQGVPMVMAGTSTESYYDVVFKDQHSPEYETAVSQTLYFEYCDLILDAKEPVASFTHDLCFDGQSYDNMCAHRIPSFTVFTFSGGDLWFPGLKFAIIDTTNRIIAELSENYFSMKEIDTNKILYESTFETGYCDKIVFNWRRLELTLQDERQQVLSFDTVPENGFSFDYLVVNQVYTETSGPKVSAEVFQNRNSYSFTIEFFDQFFPEHNKQYIYNAELPTDTIIAADIDGLVPEVGDTGNYVFLGWFDGDKTPADPLSGFIRFYAKYKEATVTFKNSDGKLMTSKQIVIGEPLRKVVEKLYLDDYSVPQNIDLDMVVTEDMTITLAEKLLVTLRYFKLERYSVEVKGKTFNYDMLTYKTVSRLIPESSLVDVTEFDSAHYNIMGKPYYETMPGFTFTGWDYDLTKPITTPLTISAQYELPKIKVNYYSSNDILFETREYDLVKDNLLLPMPEFKSGLSNWDAFKNLLENLFTLDILQMVEDISARDVANKMADHLTDLYDDNTNQIFAVLAKPDMNSNVHKGWQGDLSGDFSGSAFVYMTGAKLSNDYVLYLNPMKMYTGNINYEISLSFGDHFIDPIIHGAGNAFTAVGNWFKGVGDWFSVNWQWFLWVLGAIVGVLFLIIFGPVVIPIIIAAIKFVFGLIVKFFQLIGKLFKKIGEWLGNLFRRKEK